MRPDSRHVSLREVQALPDVDGVHEDYCCTGQSCGWKHCAHVPAWQIGAATGQSVFERQTTHRPSGSQSFPGCAEQSVSARHCTQLEEDVSQRGASLRRRRQACLDAAMALG
jgi:hypothetical protein